MTTTTVPDSHQRQREIENRVLASEKALSPDDRSPHAQAIREAAASIRDHRTSPKPATARLPLAQWRVMNLLFRNRTKTPATFKQVMSRADAGRDDLVDLEQSHMLLVTLGGEPLRLTPEVMPVVKLSDLRVTVAGRGVAWVVNNPNNRCLLNLARLGKGTREVPAGAVLDAAEVDQSVLPPLVDLGLIQVVTYSGAPVRPDRRVPVRGPAAVRLRLTSKGRSVAAGGG